LKDPNGKVNVGSEERPNWVDESAIRSPQSDFWNRIAVGDTLIGPPEGIDLDKALGIARPQSNNTQEGR